MQSLTLAPSRSVLFTPSSLLSSHRLHLLLFFRSPFSSSSSSSPPRRPESVRRQHPSDEESKAIKVSVWWDYENCGIPSGVNLYRVAQRIVSALRSSGIRGPVSINAFGDMFLMPRITQEALVSTGICLTHVPHDGKNSSDRLFMADLISWTAQNPPPVHFFLISGDSDFATILHRLRMNNYNILLSCINSRAPPSLCSAATFMWSWTPLAKGEDFTPRRFNYPPDGVYGSWYGHQRSPLDEPFAESEQIIPYFQPEQSVETVEEVKPRTIPKSVVNGIRQILCSYSEGLLLSHLRDELLRRKILNRNLFGFKKFSDLIGSMDNILMLVQPTNGESQPYVVLRSKQSIKLADEQVEQTNVEKNAAFAEPAEQEQVSIEPAEPEKPSHEKSSEILELLSEPMRPAEPGLELDTEKTDQVDKLDEGILGRLRKVFFGSSKNSEEAVPFVVKCEKDSSASLPVSVPVEKDNLTEKDREDDPREKDGAGDGGLFRRIGRWFGFGKEKGGSNLFADQKFWSDVESFLTSPDGSDLVAKSRTREELMQGLRKAGILSLRSLEEGHLIQLIDLIISEKKWIQESTSSTFPFTLSIPSLSNTSATSPESLHESITNLDQLLIRQPPPKEEVLSDCHKLAKEMLEKQPEGFLMGMFKPAFEEKYGYMLEYSKLGYTKLTSLLQMLPGIKVDVGANKVYKCDETEKENEGNSIGEDEGDSNDEDAEFDELGPVSKEVDFGYDEPSLSDEEFSDESETGVNPDLGRQTTQKPSPILKILDTFSSSKDGNVTREQPLGLDGLVDCSRRDNNNRRDLWLGDKVSKSRSLRSWRGRYQFVSTEVGNDKEKIVDSILGTLKKNGDSTVVVGGKGV